MRVDKLQYTKKRYGKSSTRLEFYSGSSLVAFHNLKPEHFERREGLLVNIVDIIVPIFKKTYITHMELVSGILVNRGDIKGLPRQFEGNECILFEKGKLVIEI